ncbi:3192_t:CDS:2, partial [Entrophospora sp. SA101]
TMANLKNEVQMSKEEKEESKIHLDFIEKVRELGKERLDTRTNNKQLNDERIKRRQQKNLQSSINQEIPEKSKAELYVDVKRQVAIKLYEKFGFKIKELVKDYYQPERDAYLM